MHRMHPVADEALFITVITIGKCRNSFPTDSGGGGGGGEIRSDWLPRHFCFNSSPLGNHPKSIQRIFPKGKQVIPQTVVFINQPRLRRRRRHRTKAINLVDVFRVNY